MNRNMEVAMVTLKDVAELAGVSQAAVSRALSEDPSFSLPEETRQKIFDAARELNYQKKTRRKKRPRPEPADLKIGILQWHSLESELQDPYYLVLRTGLEQYCVRKGIETIRVYKSDSTFASQLEGVQGIICIGKFSPEDMEYVSSLSRETIFLDMQTEEIRYNTISLDFKNAMKDVVSLLWEYGHRKVGFLGGQELLNENLTYDDRRIRYFCQFAREKGLEYNPWFLIDSFSRNSGYEMMKQILASEERPTAVFCCSDPIAFGAARAISEAGLSVPEDISLIGFDDIEEASYMVPALTTVHADIADIGEYSGMMMETLIKNHPGIPSRTVLPCRIERRGSLKNLASS